MNRRLFNGGRSFSPNKKIIMNKRYLAGLLVLMLGVSLVSAARAQVYPQGDITFVVGVPQGEFEQHVDDVGFGLNFFVGLGLGRTPSSWASMAAFWSTASSAAMSPSAPPSPT